MVGLLKPGILPITTSYAFFLLIISHFAIALFALVLVKERAEAALRRTADTDMLTGAGERRWFLSQLPRAGWKGGALAVMDLDFFKRINERLGHQAGDHVLIAFAELVRKNLRATDCFARLGGEEFGLYLPKTNEVQSNGCALPPNNWTSNSTASVLPSASASDLWLVRAWKTAGKNSLAWRMPHCIRPRTLAATA